MLNGFEKLTEDIKPHEIETAKSIVPALSRRVGKENAISNKEMREAILKHNGKKIDPVRLRRMITYIRAFNLIPMLCANHKGYFVAENREEWDKWTESMRQRIREMQSVLDVAIYFNEGKETL